MPNYARWFVALSSLLLTHQSCLAAAEGPVLAVPDSKSVLHIAIDLPEGKNLAIGNGWRLTELGGRGLIVPAQVIPAIAADGTPASGQGRLVADIPPGDKVGNPRRFQLEPDRTAAKHDARFALRDQGDKSLKISESGQPVLVYNHGTITDEKVPPKDKRRSRGCYVHPLWGLDGEVLTDDFPRDHFHHHGVFWAWPHVKTSGKEYDLWMYGSITPRFVRWLGRETGQVAAVLGVENGWFVGETKVMIERVWLRAYKSTADRRAIDFDFTWIPVGEPITLRGAEGKSYGGLTVRFAVHDAKDSVITVPSGRAKEDLPDTPLPWADLSAHFRGAKANPSGAAIFVPPDHPDYPPAWLTRHYGAMCVGWPGVKDKTFPPGKPIRLSYRIWIHKGTVEAEQLKQAYEAYASKVKWES